jgi:DNA/RNA endonuclease G (NUC1)
MVHATLSRRVALVAALLFVGCAKDALVTGPELSPSGPAFDFGTTAASPIVISQIYGGGGNAGATLKNDFIEVHNRGTAPIVIDGWSVQYASSTGSFTNFTPLSGTLGAGQYLLIKEAAGSGGTVDLPTPHITGTINMSATTGKVALVKGTAGVPPAALNCVGVTGTPCAAMIVDLVGYGAANNYERAPVGALNNTKAALRNGSGCSDTDNNSVDFQIADPAPRTTASPALTCGESAPTVAGTVPVAGGLLADPPTIDVSFSEPVNVTGSWFSISCSVSGPHAAQVTGGPQSYSFTELGAFATGESCTVTVFAASVTDQDVVDPPDAMTADFSWSFSTPGDPVVLPATRFSEIHYDHGGDDYDEQIEIEGPANTDLSGWSIVLYDGNSRNAYDTRPLTGLTIPATCGDRGVVVVPFPQIQNGGPDGFALVRNTEVVQFLSYEGTFTALDGPAAGLTSADIGVAEVSSSSDLSSLHLNLKGEWTGPSRRSFGRCNRDGPPPFDIGFSGREPLSDPALPVSFEDQLFAAVLNLNGDTVSKTVAWTSETPGVASIDERGVMHSLTEGRATFRATQTGGPADGTTATYSLPTIVATFGGTADYSDNVEFGVPTDGDASDDFVITRPQFTTSYNSNRSTPNWVSYEFDATHFGSAVDRCDCFTHDPLLPETYTHLTTADYTGAGAFAGYGIDRGHMARSFDFTSGALDNARSYYFSNIIPQAADKNQGPWAALENYLGDRARNVSDNKEVYVIVGVVGNKGTVKNEGKIVIPTHVWKVALVLDRDQGLADIRDYRDIDTVVAVIMPNEPGPRNVNWSTYQTTVDEIERISGYDLLSLLPDKIENAVESNTRPPIAAADGPYASREGGVVSVSGSASFGGAGTIIEYSWNFGDGTTASGESVSHTYAQDGNYTVRLTVTNNLGVSDTFTTPATVTNVEPTIAPFAGATLLPGETYDANGSFTDPGADPWTATVNFGDASGVQTLLLSGKTFALAHTYNLAGRFTVTVRVSDDDVSSSRTQSVTVLSQSQALALSRDMIRDLAKAGLNSGNSTSLNAKINAAQKQIENGNFGAAANQLEALLNELDAMIRSGRMTAAQTAPLAEMVNRVIRSISL